MATNINTSATRASSTTLPVQTASTSVAPPVADTGHPGASGFNPNAAPAVGAAVIAGATQLAPGVERVVGAVVVAGASAARAESVKAKVAAVTTGASKLGKVAGAANTAMSEEASLGDRIDAGIELGTAAKDAITKTKAGAKITGVIVSTAKVAGYGAGAVAGAANVVTNVKEGIANFEKAKGGDLRAAAELANNAAQTVNGAVRVVNDVAEGAKLLKAGSQVAGKALTVVTAAGPALKYIPVAGAAIGTVKAGVDFSRDPSLLNGAKVAANAIGLVPVPGAAIVASIAVAALEHPKVAAAVKAAGTRMAANWEAMKDAEPLGMAM